VPAVTYQTVFHRNENRILIQFESNAGWNKRIKKLPGARWSRTLKGWTIPDTTENRIKCKLPVGEQLTISSKAVTVHYKQLTNYSNHQTTNKTALLYISENNQQELKKYLQHLQLKAYSPSTIRTYRIEFAQLLQTLKNIAVQNLEPQHIQRYLLYCIKNGLKENSVHSRLNALKFYFEQILHRDKFFFEIPRPKRPLQLPKILSEVELKRMFAAVQNIKHKAILFTAYGSGLRVSEVVHLRIQDIDSKRMQIFVQKAKGKKDRVVPLSILVLDVLRQYIKIQQPKPRYYLFTAPNGNEAYSERSAQKIFQEAKKQAGIKKEVSFHSLRHSFATHLLEKGIDVKYIKELLGHFDIRTTERYLHVSKEKLINIVSPLDSLYEEEEMAVRIADTDYIKKRIEKQ
jgi:site-specific recombinase XerD